MNLSSFIFSFTVISTFCPLDQANLIDLNRRNKNFLLNFKKFKFLRNSTTISTLQFKSTKTKEKDFNSTLQTFKQPVQTTKRLISDLLDETSLIWYQRPSKWEAIWNELFHKPKSISSTRFFLYTRWNSNKGQELCIDDLNSIKESNFNSDKKIIFLVNGWQDNRFLAKWVRDAIKLLLMRSDSNVIYVSWRSLKELFVAAMIIRSYSNYLAKFIKFLKEKYQISGEQIHCIGHSLGGFMCGFAGDHTYIGRVSVLDAGPRPYYQSRPSNERLNRFQAGFMDVIHSDFNPSFSLGLTIPYGDIDFFPNSGTIQPGCWRDKWYKAWQELKDEGPLVSLFQIPRYLLFCSHYRSHEWFFESIWNDQCQFVGVLCPNYQMFLNGECGCEDLWSTGHAESTCALMGYDAEYAILKQRLTKFSPQGRWFLKTSDFLTETNRHCQYQYQIVLQFGEFLPLPEQISINSTITITILASDSHSALKQKTITQEILRPRIEDSKSTSARPSRIESKNRLSKLMIKANSLPLSKINTIYISWNIHQSKKKKSSSRMMYITILWIKLAPIHVISNEPIFFCHLNHFLNENSSIRMKRC